MSLPHIELPWATLSPVALLGLACTCIAHRFKHIRRKLPQLQQAHPELDRQQVRFAAQTGCSQLPSTSSSRPCRRAANAEHGVGQGWIARDAVRSESGGNPLVVAEATQM